MGRDTSPYIVGDYWLDKRRDGKSPDIWQIARYDARSRSDVYRSTKRRALDDAKPIIHAYVIAEMARKPQEAEVAAVIPQLMIYYRDHGESARNAAQIASSIRAWMGFFDQDELGSNVTFAQIGPVVTERFRKWRMAPHRYSVIWRGKEYPHESTGVKGESVQRNLDDFRAALNFAANNGRVPYAPKVPSVKTELRSRPRDVTLTIAQLGAMVAFSRAPTVLDKGDPIPPDVGVTRWLLLMIATTCRPDAALAFDPVAQDRGVLVDLHPPSWPRTKKRNPIVPCIAPFRATLDDWKANPQPAVSTRRTAFRTIRRALGLAGNVVPKTIRHTIATELRSRGVPGDEISGLMGHHPDGMSRTTGVYAHYDPAYLAKSRKVLTTIFNEVMKAADRWTADHLRTKTGNGPVIVIDNKAQKAQITKA